MRAESRVVEVEKQCSMLEFDLKQSVQKMEQLMKQKERLEDDVSRATPKRLIFDVLVSLTLNAKKRLRRSAPGEESVDTGRAGVEQARAGTE